jgi:hypothetical protein
MMAVNDRVGPDLADGVHNIRALLPWRASGRLGFCDIDEIDAALSLDAALEADYRQVCEQKALIAQDHDALGAPSLRAVANLFAAIDAETLNCATSAEETIAPKENTRRL